MVKAEGLVDGLLRERERLFQTPGMDRDGLTLAERLTAAFDRYFTRQYASIPGDLSRFALVAVGGYGRRELCLQSDVDILILFDGTIPDLADDLARTMFVPLWDIGVDLGHGVREVSECLELAGRDYEVLTSLLDARLVCGDPELFRELCAGLEQTVVPEHLGSYLDWARDGLQARHREFAGETNVLEPHLKQGLGGLRDAQYILWISAVRYGARGLDTLADSGSLPAAGQEALRGHLSFVLWVRTWLHQQAGRRTDRLHLELQTDLARLLGFEDTQRESGVERFLARLHREMRGIANLCGSFVRVHGGGAAKGPVPEISAPLSRLVGVSCSELVLNVSPGTGDRLVLMQALFEGVAETGLPLSWAAFRFVEDGLFMVDARLRSRWDTVRNFRSILESGYAHNALEQMMDTGFLGVLIPEFGKVQDMVQFDAYHTYPVGRHSIRALEYLCVESEEDTRDLFQELRGEVGQDFGLRLATLLHDVGKGRDDHAERGAVIAARVMERMRISQVVADEVVFLVRNHLLLAVTAQSRDIGDEGVIMEVAEIVGSSDRLKKLMLLTWADSRATGPKAWSRWTAALIRELFFKVLRALTQSSLAGDHAMHQLAVTRDKVRSLGRRTFDSHILESWLGAMPQRYLLQYEPGDILDHLAVVNGYAQQSAPGEPVLRMVQDEDSGCWKMTLVTRDTPGLFAVIAGVLALHNIRVYAADLHVWEDGTVLDLFWVSGPADPLYADESWERIRTSLQAALSGKMAIGHRLDKKRKYGFAKNGGLPSAAPRVCLEENGSDFFSVIEVVCDDREGLLYEVAKTLQELKLDIVFARIATRKDQVLDVFYVRDRFGEKITDDGQKEEIVRAIEYRIGGE